MFTRFPHSIGISHLSYSLPEKCVSLEEIETTSRKSVLREFGYTQSYQADNLFPLMVRSGKETMSRSKKHSEDISRVYLAHGLPEIAIAKDGNRLDMFEYPLSKLQTELGLQQSSGVAISQRGCSSFLIALQQAILTLGITEEKAAMCVAGDIWPHANREVMYNLISDAAAAVLIEQRPDFSYLQPIAAYEYTHTYYSSPALQEQELMAAYFPVAQRTITTCLQKAEISMEDIAWIVPHNVNLNSWKILRSMLGISEDKVWLENVSGVGHTISCDQIINTKDMIEASVVKNGDYLLWFTFGFGASWLAMIVQYHE